MANDFASIRAFKAKLRKLPTSLAHRVASLASPALTRMTQRDYDTGRNVYGEPRLPGVEGQPLDLKESGATRGQVRFVTTGTVTRCVLGTPYAKYLIRYGILPNGGLPVAWSRRLKELADQAEKEVL